MRVLIFDQLDEKVLGDWKNLWETSPDAHFFNSPEWFLSSQETFEYSKIKILACYKGESLLGIFPLVGSKKYGIKTLNSPGNQYMDKSSLLISEDNPKVLKALIKELSNLDNFYLTNIDQDTVLDLGYNYRLNIKSIITCRKLPLLPNPYQYIPGKKQKRIRKAINDSSGALNYKMFLGKMDELLGKIIEIETKSPKRKNYKDIFSDPKLIKLCLSLNSKAPERFLVSLLYYDEEPICFKYGFLANGIYHDCNMAFNADYADFIPGRVLTYSILPELLKMGIKTADFSRGDTQFKKEFTPFVYEQYAVYYSKNLLITWWWKSMDLLFDYLEIHPNLFETIRRIKKILTRNIVSTIKSLIKPRKELAKI